jgi:hypothetical protein
MTRISDEPATSAIKAKMSHILATAAGAGKLHSVAIEEGLSRVD